MTQQTKMPEPVAWITNESLYGLKAGRTNSKGAVPVHASRSYVAKTPLITTTQAQAYADARVREALQWKPIDTAPQGQIALFYDANATVVRHCMFVDWMVDGAFCGNRHHTATHWAPLPAPPQQ